MIFTGSYCDGYPFPRLYDIGLKLFDGNKFQQISPKFIDDNHANPMGKLNQQDAQEYYFFDLIEDIKRDYSQDFIRLT